jgi:DNA polymerase I-like protein with 3'-5' exonuclease and polymerase domains
VVIGTIHDEIVVETNQETVTETKAWLHDHMVAAGQEMLATVPVEAEVVVRSSWAKEG